jgi:hypothetical protein
MFEGTFTELGESVLFLLLLGLLLRGLTVMTSSGPDKHGIPPSVPSLTSEAWIVELLDEGMFCSLLSWRRGMQGCYYILLVEYSGDLTSVEGPEHKNFDFG